MKKLFITLVADIIYFPGKTEQKILELDIVKQYAAVQAYYESFHFFLMKKMFITIGSDFVYFGGKTSQNILEHSSMQLFKPVMEDFIILYKFLEGK